MASRDFPYECYSAYHNSPPARGGGWKGTEKLRARCEAGSLIWFGEYVSHHACGWYVLRRDGFGFDVLLQMMVADVDMLAAPCLSVALEMCVAA